MLGAWVPWAATRAGLPEFLTQEALAMIAEIGDEALEALSDRTRWSPAKRLAMQMLAGEVGLAEVDAVGEWPLSGAG